MIEVKNLHKSFGDSQVLKGISTVFEKGKTNLIIGQSGSGKTVTIAPPAGQFIDGSSANRTITTQYKALVVVSDGAHWYILSEFDGTF